MYEEPDVSVVMSVFNSAGTLATTLESILTQQGVGLEFILVDDGASDGSGAILDDYARRDSRVRIIHQANTGLTRALIRGCAEARGRYIARQDAGDQSLPGRLAQQCALLDENPDVVMTSCGTRFLGPEGEWLDNTVQGSNELALGLQQQQSNRLRGPSHHGSVMFRRSAYQAVGGYRAAFRVAQDMDLWVRLIEWGGCLATPEVLYQATWTLGSISHVQRVQQVLATRAIVACRTRRRRGEFEAPVRERLARDLARPRPAWTAPPNLVNARFYYYIASLLEQRQPVVARQYLGRAIHSWPWHLKAWVKLARLATRGI